MDYPLWIARRVRQRKAMYASPPSKDLFSLITPVYDTPPRFLRAMAASVFAQDYPWFEWVIVDNGSTRSETRRVLQRLRRDPRVTLCRVEPNRGIMGGTRIAVQRARNRYLVPVDSDDLLCPDALRVMASCLHSAGYPTAAYSDEDKTLANGTLCNPFFKPDWDPVLFLNCCYIAHLCAISRTAADGVGAYADDEAHGCHDWDTFCRLILAGHTPLHVPEVLYSWRMHQGSTASDNSSKPYTIDCQRYVLGKYLAHQGQSDRFEIRVNPLFGNVGLWYAARQHVHPKLVQVLILARGSPGDRRRLLRTLAESSYPLFQVQITGPIAEEERTELTLWDQMPGKRGMRVRVIGGNSLQSSAVHHYLTSLPQETLVAVLDDTLTPITSDWPWEALGFFERYPDTVVVGGRVFDSAGRIVSAGEVFGMDGILGCPDRRWHDGDPGYYGLFISQRTVDAVSGSFFVTTAGFLQEALADLPHSPNPAVRGAWLGALARRKGKRVVYTPHIAAQGPNPLSAPTTEEAADFLKAHGPLLQEAKTYSRFLSRESASGYCLAASA
jgi:hypothetical protein